MTLAIEGVTVHFAGLAAVDEVSLQVAPGEWLGLVGPNGAGKSTLLDVVSGLVRPRSGRVTLFDRPLTGLPPERVAHAGVSRTFQSPRLFTRMTVRENARAGRALDPRASLRWARLDARADELAAALTPAGARRLELVRAVAGAPELLLLDEPCGGLNAAETDEMVRLIREAATPDRIVILVEHKLGVIRRLCRRAVVLHLGRLIHDGPVDALERDPRVVEAYLGSARVR